MRILASAYACEPGKGSEPGVGWNWVRQIARFHEVWVITRSNNRPSIEAALAEEPAPSVHWVYFDLPRWARFWKRGGRGVRLYYYLWQLGAYFVGKRLHQQVGFEVVHHLTFVNYWMPSFLALLPAPFVWGPVGGGESAPGRFWSHFSLRGKAYEIGRDLARHLGELDPFVRLTARRAIWALSTTEDTGKRLQALGCKRVFVHSQVGLHGDEIHRFNDIPLRDDNPFRVVSVGELLHWKGFELGVLAFAQFHRRFPASEYWIIGDGPERKRLERRARRLGVASKVRFWGLMPRSQVLEKLAECDVLLHPSLHDSGGWVCLEAMAASRPVICLDCGGPALLVTDDTGIKVPAISPEQVVVELAAALDLLADNLMMRAHLGAAARSRVREHFNWDNRFDFLETYAITPSEVSTQAC